MKVERSRHVVLVLPPAVERAGDVWPMLEKQTIIVCADSEQATAFANAAPAELHAHAVTGLGRTAALLKEGRAQVLAGSPADLAALVARAALKLDALESVVIAWPESFAPECDTLLAEAPDARRIVLSWNPPAIADFLERHARRAEIRGNIPLDIDGRPLGPVASVRYAITSVSRRATAVRDALDAARAIRPYVWNGGPIESREEETDLVVCTTPPLRDELQALAGISREQPIVLALASQLPYLTSIATLTPFSLPGAADRAQDRNAALRARIVERLDQGDVDAELALLAPLFEKHDPALVAAALLAISDPPRAVGEVAPTPSQDAGWVRVFVNVGRKDRASAKDLVGAMIKEAGLQKGQIGKIDVRETFSLVEIAPRAVDQAVRRLTGVSIRGRRVAARPDRV